MQGLMQDTPLAMPHLFNRAESLFAKKEIVTATGAGVERTTYGEWAHRSRKLGGVLDTLGITAAGRVATTTLARPRSSRSRSSSGVNSVVAGITTAPSFIAASMVSHKGTTLPSSRRR